MDNFLFYAHSGLRWLVVLSTVIALGWMAYGLVTTRDYDRLSYRIMTAFSSLVGLQWVLGLVLTVYRALTINEYLSLSYVWSHLGTMTIALAVAHVHFMVKKRPDRVRFIAGLGSVVVALALVFVGVALLPQGWGM